MPDLLYHVGATAICPHSGQVTVASTNSRVLVSGQPVATMGDTFMIAGCPFTIGPKPQPCIKVQWLMPATRVFINGQAAILKTSTGICQSAEQIPQGPPTVAATQTRVSGI
jgi:uncharacterized Zn-binding protein involved in type VI secretion